MWSGVIDSLSPKFRCMAPDLPGYGRSQAPDGFDYTLEGQAEFVGAMYSGLGLSRPIKVIGHDSFSGWEDRYLAAPKKVPVLVLWGENDPYIPSDMAEHFDARRIVRYPGSGHWLPVVEARKVATEVAAFFAADVA